jgi:predicted hotdog family 3-hydroxylacyl-ACP dehydratase
MDTMIQAASLAALLPHAGSMVLLDAVVSWDERAIRCRSRSHLAPDNPLRRDGRLHAICGVEYALQAAALHGAMRAGGVAQKAGYVARLRDVVLAVPYLDDPALGTLGIEATLEHGEAGGMLYGLLMTDIHGNTLISARAGISLP